MKSLVQVAMVAAALAAPVVSFAQSNAPVTRAQVRAELVQLEQAGYKPARGQDPHYPDSIQSVTNRVAAQKDQTAQSQGVDNSGYGAQAQGGSAAGLRTAGVRPATAKEMKALYHGL